MNIRLQIIVAVLLVIAILYIINMVKKGKADLRYTLVWLFLGVIFLIFDLLPQVQQIICKAIGISSPQNMLLFVSIGFILIILFNLTIIVSSQIKKIERLVQENALLAGELEKEKTRQKKECNNESYYF